MAILTRESLLAQAGKPLPVYPVEVAELGGTVYVRTLSAKEADDFEAAGVVRGKDGKTKPNLVNFRGRLAALVLANEQGGRLCTDDDAGMLGDLPKPVLDKIVRKANEVNGLDSEAVEAEKGN